VNSIDLRVGDPRVRLAGILDLTPMDRGALTERLPAWARAQLVDPAIGFVSSMPSGGRLEFVTDATTIELEAVFTRLEYGGITPHTATVDLVVDGALVASEALTDTDVIRFPDRAATDFEMVHLDPSVIRFDGLTAGRKHVEIWLAQNASCMLRELRLDDGASLESPGGVHDAPGTSGTQRRRWVHYGSSISHCMEAEHPTGTWPAVVARAAGVDLYSLGLAGQCQLDQFAARTIRDLPADLISLKLGINLVNADSMRERAFVPAVHGMLDTIRDGHPETPIVVISPIICPAAEDHPGPTLPNAEGTFDVFERADELMPGALSLSRIRKLLEIVIAQRQQAGDANLSSLDGHELFGPDDVDDLPDGLHPNSAGYQRMGERFTQYAFAADGPFA
jgi:lysophospholipase L1-like esterase